MRREDDGPGLFTKLFLGAQQQSLDLGRNSLAIFYDDASIEPQRFSSRLRASTSGADSLRRFMQVR